MNDADCAKLKDAIERVRPWVVTIIGGKDGAMVGPIERLLAYAERGVREHESSPLAVEPAPQGTSGPQPPPVMDQPSGDSIPPQVSVGE